MTSPASQKTKSGPSTDISKGIGGSGRPAPPNISDPFADLMEGLDERRRRGLERRLAVGYYDGWHPTRADVASLIAVETGHITAEEYYSLPTEPCSYAGLHTIDNEPPGNGAPMPSIPPTPVTNRRPPRQRSAGALPARYETFRVDCGRVIGSFRFIALGLAHSGWLQRGTRRYRLIHLQYELVPGQGRTAASFPKFFTAPITCVEAPAIDLKGKAPTSTHVLVDDKILGSHGPWPLPSNVQHLRFRIFRKAEHGTRYLLAGCLHFDEQRGARWRPWSPPPSSRSPRAVDWRTESDLSAHGHATGIDVNLVG